METYLKKLGYTVAGVQCNSANFGLPQQRNRAWIMCVLSEQALPGAKDAMEADLATFKCPRVPLANCISPTPAENVTGKLVVRSAKTKSSKPKWLTNFKDECDRLGKAGHPVIWVSRMLLNHYVGSVSQKMH